MLGAAAITAASPSLRLAAALTARRTGPLSRLLPLRLPRRPIHRLHTCQLHTSNVTRQHQSPQEAENAIENDNRSSPTSSTQPLSQRTIAFYAKANTSPSHASSSPPKHSLIKGALATDSGYMGVVDGKSIGGARTIAGVPLDLPRDRPGWMASVLLVCGLVTFVAFIEIASKKDKEKKEETAKQVAQIIAARKAKAAAATSSSPSSAGKQNNGESTDGNGSNSGGLLTRASCAAATDGNSGDDGVIVFTADPRFSSSSSPSSSSQHSRARSTPHERDPASAHDDNGMDKDNDARLARLHADARAIFDAALEAADPAGMIRRVLSIQCTNPTHPNDSSSSSASSTSPSSSSSSPSTSCSLSVSLGDGRSLLYDLDHFRRILVVGSGKASVPMAKAVEDVFLLKGEPINDIIDPASVVVTKRVDEQTDARKHEPDESSLPPSSTLSTSTSSTPHSHPSLKRIRVLEASHPLPDSSSLAATQHLISLLSSNRDLSDTLVLFLLSGGSSSLLTGRPTSDVSLAELLETNRTLTMRSGMDIQTLNWIRKHIEWNVDADEPSQNMLNSQSTPNALALSAPSSSTASPSSPSPVTSLKGGGVLRCLGRTQLLTLILSDVLGDDLQSIGSGPTVPFEPDFMKVLQELEWRGLRPTRKRRERDRRKDFPEQEQNVDEHSDEANLVVAKHDDRTIPASVYEHLLRGAKLQMKHSHQSFLGTNALTNGNKLQQQSMPMNFNAAASSSSSSAVSSPSLLASSPTATSSCTNVLIGSNRLALESAAGRARSLGYEPTTILTDRMDGEASEMGSWIARAAIDVDHDIDANLDLDRMIDGRRSQRKPRAWIAGGETTVSFDQQHSITGAKVGLGLGGRNQELALSAAIQLDQIENRPVPHAHVQHHSPPIAHPFAPVAPPKPFPDPARHGTVILAAGTDGIDGPTDAAGGIVDGRTVPLASSLAGMDARDYLKRHDSYSFFHKLDEAQRRASANANGNPSAAAGQGQESGVDASNISSVSGATCPLPPTHIKTGSTGTNVADVVVALVR